MKTTHKNTMPMHGALPRITRPTYLLTFRPEPGVDGVAALQQLLKRALRTHGLRCIEASIIEAEHDGTATAERAGGSSGVAPPLNGEKGRRFSPLSETVTPPNEIHRAVKP